MIENDKVSETTMSHSSKREYKYKACLLDKTKVP